MLNFDAGGKLIFA